MSNLEALIAYIEAATPCIPKGAVWCVLMDRAQHNEVRAEAVRMAIHFGAVPPDAPVATAALLVHGVPVLPCDLLTNQITYVAAETKELLFAAIDALSPPPFDPATN